MGSTIKPKQGICARCGCDCLIYSKKMCEGCYWQDNREKNDQKRLEKENQEIDEFDQDEPPKKKYKQKKPISKKSKKQKVLDAKYSVLRIEFLGKKENQVCPVTGEKTTDVHHMMGRVGYADDWARFNNIPLIIDVRYFLAVSRRGHQHIEENPEWAKEKGFSKSRLANNEKGD